MQLSQIQVDATQDGKKKLSGKKKDLLKCFSYWHWSIRYREETVLYSLMILVLTFPNHCMLHTISHLKFMENNKTCITAMYKQILGIELRKEKIWYWNEEHNHS